MSNFTKFNVKELRDIISRNNIPVSSPGSGKNGNLIKKDLIFAIQKHQAQKVSPRKVSPRKVSPRKVSPRKVSPRKSYSQLDNLKFETPNPPMKILVQYILKYNSHINDESKADLIVKVFRSPIRKALDLSMGRLYESMSMQKYEKILKMCKESDYNAVVCEDDYFWYMWIQNKFKGTNMLGKNWKETAKILSQELNQKSSIVKNDLYELSVLYKKGTITKKEAAKYIRNSWPKTTFKGKSLYIELNKYLNDLGITNFEYKLPQKLNLKMARDYYPKIKPENIISGEYDINEEKYYFVPISKTKIKNISFVLIYK